MQMLAEKRWKVASTFSLVGGVFVGIGMVLTTSVEPFLDGGLDGVIQFFKANGEGYSDSWKWTGFLGGLLGAWAGFVVWRWLALRTGLLTQEEIDEGMGVK